MSEKDDELKEAQIEFYRLQSAKLADDLLRKQQVRDTAASVARGTVSAVGTVVKVIFYCIGLIVAVVVWRECNSGGPRDRGVSAPATPATNAPPESMQDRVKVRCRHRGELDGYLIVLNALSGSIELATSDQVRAAPEIYVKPKTCAEVLAGGWPL